MMSTAEFLAVLKSPPGVTIEPRGDLVRVTVASIGVTATLPIAALRADVITDPFGDVAARMEVLIEGEPVQLIVSKHDLVLAPRVCDLGIGIDLGVTDMPPLVGFSEVVRGLDEAKELIDRTANFDEVVGLVAMLRYFIAGAERLKIDCAQLLVKWNALRTSVGLFG